MSGVMRQALADVIDRETAENRIASLTNPVGFQAASVRLSFAEWDEVCRALREEPSAKTELPPNNRRNHPRMYFKAPDKPFE